MACAKILLLLLGRRQATAAVALASTPIWRLSAGRLEVISNDLPSVWRGLGNELRASID